MGISKLTAGFPGILVLCLSFTNNFGQLMAIRFLQGLAESVTYPGLIIITAAFCKKPFPWSLRIRLIPDFTDTRKEHTLRLAIWTISNQTMDIICSLITYAIAKKALSNPGGFAAWRAISVFLGGLTILFSVVIYFVFGMPREVRWLSEREKRVVDARVVDNQTGSDGG